MTLPKQQKSLQHMPELTPDVQAAFKAANDQAWIEVIQQMDNIYADLVRYQVELEEKNAELENAQRFIKSVISSMSDILIVCDVNGNILEVNAALEATYAGANNLKGKPLKSLFGPDHQTLITDLTGRAHFEELSDCEVELVDAQGEAIPLSINCNARFDHKNRFSGFVITGRPLGELRKAYSELHIAHEDLKSAQAQLIQSEKMASLGRMVAGVAHELNNPISFLYANMHALSKYERQLRSYLNALHDDVGKSVLGRLRKDLQIDQILNDIDSLVEGSTEGAERVTQIVKNLRRFANPQPPVNERIELTKLIKRACAWVFKVAPKVPEVDIRLPDSLSIVNSEVHIHQILINLIQNAVDALVNQKKPIISISAKMEKDQLHIIIRDNGPGIREADLVKVFDPFFTTKAVGYGTGLGLYISYGLATSKCGGELRANNHPEGGAMFTLSLPLTKSGKTN